MTSQQIVGLAARLLAIWLAFSALQIIGNGIALNNQQGLEPTAAFFVWAGIMFLLTALLWFFPMVIAHKFIPRTKFEDTLHIPASQAVMIACVIFGLWLFTVRVLPRLAYYLSMAAMMIAHNQRLAISDQFNIVGLGTVAIEFAVAAVLCFKAHTIARFFTIKCVPDSEE